MEAKVLQRHPSTLKALGIILLAMFVAFPLDARSSNNLIIFYDSEIGNSYLLDAVKRSGAEILYKYENFNAIAISLPDSESGPDIDKAIAGFRKVKGVISVERDRIYHLDSGAGVQSNATPSPTRGSAAPSDSLRISAKLMKVECGPWVSDVTDNSFTVCWTTSEDASAWVETAPDDGSDFFSAVRPKFYETFQGRRTVGRFHHVTVTGLKPGTSCRYCIISKQALLNQGRKRIIYDQPIGTEEQNTVRTLDPGRKNCRFAMFNDVHEADGLMRDEIDAEPITPDKYDFVLFNGDMSSQMDSLGDIYNYLRPSCAAFAGDVPIFTARGNHECRGDLADDYLEFFPTSTGKTYYTFREGPAFFVVLDGGDNNADDDIDATGGIYRFDSFRSEEAGWLRKVVKSADYRNAPVRIIVLHMPPETKRQWEGKEMVKDFASILNGTHVALMLCGHEHERIFYKAGSEKSGCDFPVFVNDLHARADIKVTPKKIEISAHKNSHTISLE